MERILPHKLEELREIAKSKDAEKVERFGVILKSKGLKKKPLYKFCECKSDESWEKWPNGTLKGESNTFFYWRGDKMYGATMPVPDKETGIIDLNNIDNAVFDNNYVIEFWWHTHPPLPTGDGWPSKRDKNECINNDIVGLMIQYIGRQRHGKTEDDWIITIIDTNGETYDYTPPPKPNNKPPTKKPRK